MSDKFRLLLVFFCLVPSGSFEFVGSLLGAAGIASIMGAWNYGRCKYNECCDDHWIKKDFNGLENDLETKLYGQHLVRNIVLRALRYHLNNENPRKALVLSFHGRTGSGKNHVASMVVNRIFKLGMRSQYVKLWIGKLHFLHDSMVPEYQEEIQDTIRKMVKRCPRSVFIIDEADSLPRGVIDALKPFLDYHENVDGVDYREATFIFLSNTGSDDITKVTYEFWTQKAERESITMKDIEPLVKLGSFNEKGIKTGGLYKAGITKNSLIDAYVPFLPLEKSHVLLCARDHLEERGCRNSEELLRQVAESMEYEPPALYSKTGCKTIDAKITMMFGDECDI